MSILTLNDTKFLRSLSFYFRYCLTAVVLHYTIFKRFATTDAFIWLKCLNILKRQEFLSSVCLFNNFTLLSLLYLYFTVTSMFNFLIIILYYWISSLSWLITCISYLFGVESGLNTLSRYFVKVKHFCLLFFVYIPSTFLSGAV